MHLVFAMHTEESSICGEVVCRQKTTNERNTNKRSGKRVGVGGGGVEEEIKLQSAHTHTDKHNMR